MKNTKADIRIFDFAIFNSVQRDVLLKVHELYIRMEIYLLEPKRNHSNIFMIGISNDAKKVSPFTKCSVSDGKRILIF